MKKITKFIIAKRIIILSIVGGAIYATMYYFNINIGYLVLFGIGTGVIFGKVFCRWMCPIGFLMEMIMGGSKQFSSMYQYHKMGCPIAWASGLLNKWSIFRIKINKDTCISCGKCDKECYLSTIEPAKYSLYKPTKQNSGDAYSCSKCLKCVVACPNGSLKYKI
ncbi:MAG: 4Fe-4S binding protein [Paludibacter sp.]|nr:4Fe-4S binding protein [Paludibacter sp.]